MNAEDIAALAAALQPAAGAADGGGRAGHMKIKPFSSGRPQDWVLWKKKFKNAVAVNQWTNGRARVELDSAFEPPASDMVSGVEHGVVQGQDAPDYNLMLNQLDEIFMPAVAQDFMIMQVRAAREEQQESIAMFHGRYRSLYSRAYPDVAEVNGGYHTWKDMIDGFINGLKDPDVAREARIHRPLNYTEALEAAQSAFANKWQTQNAGKLGGSVTDPLAVGTRKEMMELANKPSVPFAGKCHYCGKAGHMKRDCRSFDRVKQQQRQEQGSGQEPSRGRGRGGFRGRGRGRGGSHQRGRPSHGNSSNQQPSIAEMQRELQELRHRVHGDSESEVAPAGKQDKQQEAGNAGKKGQSGN